MGCSSCAAAKTETTTFYSKRSVTTPTAPFVPGSGLRTSLGFVRCQRMPTLLPKKGREWTDEEEAEIARLRAACGDGEHKILECGHTDEGDPWCIIYDQPHHRTVVHIARIDRRYVVIVPPKGSSWIATMKAAVDLAIAHISPAQAF
jgi:hypothetical protein